jgi:hypothetical protein
MEGPLLPHQIPHNYTPPPQTPPPIDKRAVGRIFRFNMLLWLAYFIVVMVLAKLDHDGTMSRSVLNSQAGQFLLWGYMALYLGHAFILIVLGIIQFIRRQPAYGGMYILTAFLIPLIGFGACTAVFFSGIMGRIEI